MIKKVRVIIPKHGFIPGIGQGPFWSPMYLSIEKYNQLKSLGYPMEVVETIDSKLKRTSKKKTDQKPVTPKKTASKKEETVKEEIKEIEKEITEAAKEEKEESTPTITEDEEVNEDEHIEVIEVVQNDPNLSAEGFYTESFLKSKNICKKILDARQVQYKYNDNYKTLVDRVLETNPEVEIVEE